MSFKEWVDMIANIGVPVAVLIAAIALFLNIRAFNLQKRELRASLFNSIAQRIDSLLDQQKECEKKGQDALVNWYMRLICAFEYYAFFAINNYLTEEMSEYYSDAIKRVTKQVSGYPKIVDWIRSSSETELIALRSYYKNIIGESFPI